MLEKPALYFKSPYQLVSWVKPERWLKEYFIVFTERFIHRHKPLADLIFNLPFFKLEQAIPFEIEPEDVEWLTLLYGKILTEYQSENEDRFELIASYTHTLLLQVRRLYFKYATGDSKLVAQVQQSDHSLVDRFLTLLRKTIGENQGEKPLPNVKFFASQLSTHPNHLTAVVKRNTQKTAIELIHEQVIYQAKSLLRQTSLSVKEIAFQLGYADALFYIHKKSFLKVKK